MRQAEEDWAAWRKKLDTSRGEKAEVDASDPTKQRNGGEVTDYPGYYPFAWERGGGNSGFAF